ncbi:MAG: DUF4097 family beta strand repeat protein [Lachnospiraceae bacterium]|nr:DUF4097 family beta strand repeat protein [Lachnospiraceae bacterium]MBR3510065.1 DUF4097 family beta strand repeat protein [Lachnospiraceae bacterium]MBR4604905.1 DUF4097 family beta strand repeat protein [Lachnospiraceae bacterium]MBR6149710.1 DUF4097 family beta strand repeat protein [Lachnospiraceae bacterium]
MRKWVVWNLIGLALCVIGIGVIMKTLIRADFDIGAFSNVSYVTNTYDLEDSFSDLTISGNAENIIFIPSKDGVCHITLLEEEKALHQVSVENDTLTIRSRNDKEWYEHIWFLTQRPCITIALPKKVYDRMMIETNVGEVELTDLSCKELFVTQNTGDVTLERVIASEGLYVKSDTGDIEFEECDAAIISMETATGDMEGTLLTGKQFDAKTSTGKIDVPESSDGGTCKLRTNTGSIQVTIVQERGTKN